MSRVNKLRLIPQPHTLLSGEGVLSDGPNQRMTIRWPIPDRRIIAAAETLFASVSTQTKNGSGYSICSEGVQPNYQWLKRIDGRHDGYVLLVRARGIEIYAQSTAGLFYGLKTLKQIIDEKTGDIPFVTIFDWADTELRSTYLDMRTLFPKFENILSLIETMADYKLNAITIEYEDKLRLPNLPYLFNEKFGLTCDQFATLKKVAHDNYLEIIPLQQTFGHLEYVLKHEPHVHLREMPDIVGEMCPHRQGAFELAAQLIQDMAALHPESRYLHIGCDEVWSLGSCEACRNSNLTREQAFIGFVNRLIDKVCQLGKIPLIWHDMLSHASEDDIALLDKRAVICIWIYNGNDLEHKAAALIERFFEAGLDVFGCGSVRSWDFSGHQNYPVVENRLKNVVFWKNVAVKFQLRGIINTSWAASFSLAKPYGLFETALYPLFYASELNWNNAADMSTYLERFLFQFHGMSAFTLSERGFNNDDYYKLIPDIIQDIRKNIPIAKLVAAMRAFEWPANDHFPLSIILYRCALYPEKIEEAASLAKKLATVTGQLEGAYRQMNEILQEFLPKEMAEEYLQSRFYVEDLYKREAEKLIRIKS